MVLIIDSVRSLNSFISVRSRKSLSIHIFHSHMPNYNKYRQTMLSFVQECDSIAGDSPNAVAACMHTRARHSRWCSDS